MTVRLGLGVIVALVLLGLARQADACSCFTGSPCQIFRGSGAVFVADVVDVPHAGDPIALDDPKVVRMRVVRACKGSLRTGDLLTIKMPAGDSAACSLDVEQRGRWVVYASADVDGYATDLCSGSYWLDGETMPDLPPRGGDVSGLLYRTSERVGLQPAGIADTPVWVDVPGRRVVSRTAREGAFMLRGVPPGKWTVHFDVGPDDIAEGVVELENAEACAAILVEARPAGAVAGRVVDSAGRPVAGASVQVLPVVPAGNEFGGHARTDETGAFTVTGVKPGAHVVGVGLYGTPSVDFPFTPVYYPTAADRRDARAVEVARTTVRLPPIAIGAPLPIRTFVAEVVCRDGTRPALFSIQAERLPRNDRSRAAEFTSAEPQDGRHAVRVIGGYRYAVRGSLPVTVPYPDSRTGRHYVQGHGRTRD